MGAWDEDFRHDNARHLGVTEIIAADNTSKKTALALIPGKYAVRVRNVSGAAIAWFKMGPFADVVATAAAPSTPFDVGGTVTTAADRAALARPLFEVIVRPGPAGAVGAEKGALDGIAVILDAGTASVIITKVSRDPR